MIIIWNFRKETEKQSKKCGVKTPEHTPTPQFNFAKQLFFRLDFSNIKLFLLITDSSKVLYLYGHIATLLNK